MANKSYKVASDSFTHVTSAPDKPVRFDDLKRGDKVTMDEVRGDELVEAGALEPASGRSRSDAGAKPGDQTKAPKGKADGVGDGDEPEGSIGDGGPDPAGTGSDAGTGDGGGAGDGQGSATGSSGASDSQPPSTGGRRRGGASA